MHTGLRYFLGLFKFLHGLSKFLIGDFALSFLLVVKVQASAFQLLEMVLGRGWL